MRKRNLGLEKIVSNSLMIGIAHEALFIENGNNDEE
jgi:hypothetical protein